MKHTMMQGRAAIGIENEPQTSPTCVTTHPQPTVQTASMQCGMFAMDLISNRLTALPPLLPKWVASGAHLATPQQ
jgi:hypothetical protein